MICQDCTDEMAVEIARLNRENDQVVAEWRDLAETFEKFTIHTLECRLSRDPFEDTPRFCTCGLYQAEVKLHELKVDRPWTDFSNSFTPTTEDSEPV